MIANKNFARFLLAGIFVLAGTGAQADAIDGDWCSPKEPSHLTISGPNIVTPSGSQTSGNYTRHSFSFVVPGSDPGAGSTVEMRLLNEQEVRISGMADSAEVWRRCKLVS